MAEFFTVITNAGRELVAQATQAGEKVNITHMAVGDGGGVPVTPNEEQTQLVNECWRGLVSTYKQEGTSLIIDTYIPPDEGNFTIREMGVFTADGVLFAVCNTPAMPKVLPIKGAVDSFVFGMKLDVTNIDMSYIEIHTNPMLDFIKNSEKGQPNGVATLDEHGKVKELPELNFDPAGSAATVQGNLNAHINNKQNPHGVTAAQVGAYDKNQSLTSVTAGLFGLPASAVPNDVLNKIKTLMDASSGEISQRIRMITGAYIGDSVEYNTPNPRTISLGVYPLAVMVSLNGMDFGTFTNVSGGIAFRDNPVYAKPTVNANENLIEAITITSNGFVVDNYMANGCAAFTNRTNYGTYYYIAFY